MAMEVPDFISIVHIQERKFCITNCQQKSQVDCITYESITVPKGTAHINCFRPVLLEPITSARGNGITRIGSYNLVSIAKIEEWVNST